MTYEFMFCTNRQFINKYFVHIAHAHYIVDVLLHESMLNFKKLKNSKLWVMDNTIWNNCQKSSMCMYMHVTAVFYVYALFHNEGVKK